MRISVPLEEHDATALVARREVVAVVVELDCGSQRVARSSEADQSR